jgi:hypothetical protein
MNTDKWKNRAPPMRGRVNRTNGYSTPGELSMTHSGHVNGVYRLLSLMVSEFSTSNSVNILSSSNLYKQHRNFHIKQAFGLSSSYFAQYAIFKEQAQQESYTYMKYRELSHDRADCRREPHSPTKDISVVSDQTQS